MKVQEAIANRFYKDFEDALYDFTFSYKTEQYSYKAGDLIEDATILRLCEECFCSAHNIAYEDYVNETSNKDYNTIFCNAGDMTEEIINIMLARFAKQHHGNTAEKSSSKEFWIKAHEIMGKWSSYEFSEWKTTGKVPDNG